MTCTVGGITLDSAPVFIGAGVCKTVEKIHDWLKVAPVVGGSITLPARPGNEGRLQHPDALEEFLALGFGLNNWGMPNRGFPAVTKELTGMNTAHPLVVSLAGFSVGEYLSGVQAFSKLSNVDAIELNFGCPNTEHREILSFDPKTLKLLLRELQDVPQKKPLWLKFSPFSNPAELSRQADRVSEFTGIVKAVVTCNTFPNGFAGTSAIKANNGNFGGVSGPALKPIAMGQVRQFRTFLPKEIDVVGVGGITKGNDIIDFLEAGASAVQLTSLPCWLGEPSKFWDHLTTGPDSHRFTQYLERSST